MSLKSCWNASSSWQLWLLWHSKCFFFFPYRKSALFGLFFFFCLLNIHEPPFWLSWTACTEIDCPAWSRRTYLKPEREKTRCVHVSQLSEMDIGNGSNKGLFCHAFSPVCHWRVQSRRFQVFKTSWNLPTSEADRKCQIGAEKAARCDRTDTPLSALCN